MLMTLPSICRLLGAAMFAAAVSSMAAGPSAAFEIAPHRAFYAMTLGSVRPSSGVVDARGAMMLEWSESCDGWENQQRIRLRIGSMQSQDIDLDTSFTSSESKDGLKYRFSSRTTRDGIVEEDLRGRAVLDGPGMGGEAIFTLPEERHVRLPAGAVFPTEHTLLLIDAARSGQKLLSRVVFDGATEDGPFEVNALLGTKAAADAVPVVKPLADQPFWRSRLAYFPIDARSPEPVWEISVSFQENGVARQFVLDYGDFTIDAILEGIEALPKPNC